MPTSTLAVEMTDAQFLSELKTLIDRSAVGVKTELRSEFQSALKQRLTRPPGGYGDDPAARDSLGAAFLKQENVAAYLRNPQPGGVRCELQRPVLIDRKAATITGGGWPTPPAYAAAVALRPRRRLVLRDVLTIFPLTSASLVYLVENQPVPAAPGATIQVAEGDLKSEVGFAATSQTCTPSTIAAWVTASRQILDDAMYLQQYIDQRLTYEVSFVEEREFLTGDGSAGHIKGLLASATPYDAARTKAGDTGLDVLSHAETQLEELDVSPTAIVISPADAEVLRLTKTTYGSYVWDSDVSNVDEPNLLWGLTVVATNSMPKGQFLVGDFSPASAQIIERETAVVQISYEHSDYFVRNLVALRCEERAGLAIYCPWAFVTGTLAGAAAQGSTGKK